MATNLAVDMGAGPARALESRPPVTQAWGGAGSRTRWIAKLHAADDTEELLMKALATTHFHRRNAARSPCARRRNSPKSTRPRRWRTACSTGARAAGGGG